MKNKALLPISASLGLCGLPKAPLLTKEGWQARRLLSGLTGWFSLALMVFAATVSAQLPAPKDVIGFTPGDDRKLASWASIVDYFQKLDKASDRLMFQEIGKTTMGAPFVYATISSPENLKQLQRYEDINARLADPRKLGGDKVIVQARSKDGSRENMSLREVAAKRLIAQGKTIVLITCGVHSTEVGSTLSSMLIAHKLASSSEPEIQNILKNTIILLVPSLNPDGVDIVKNWYDKTLGTPFEGTEPPELYHKYVGHDNNRDWYAFTQVETQLTVDKIHNVWHPQIVHDIHQQGQNGSRLFLPPYMQPVEPNVPKQIVEGYTELGNAMAADLRSKGFQGITTNSTYDAWTPARAYSHYHGGVRILSETASAKLATPVNIKFENLRVAADDGYDPKVESPNFGPVWRGGEWKLSNITDTMTTAAFSLLNHAANNREKWLSRFYEIGKEAVRPRKDGELNAFVIDHYRSRNEFALSSIFERAGVETTKYDRPTINGTKYLSGVTVVPIGQPYGSFAKALLENQSYPDLLDREGHPITPYDVTAHTLSLLLGVDARPMFAQVNVIPGRGVGYGTGIGAGQRCSENLNYGLYKSDQASMDEGWSRWSFEKNKYVFENVGLYEKYCSAQLQSITKSVVQSNSELLKLKTIIFPDQSAAQILNGYAKGSMPDEYVGGVGKEGVANLGKFVENGGTLVFLNRSSQFAIEQFNLPIKDVTRGLNRKDFYIPGSILRTELRDDHPITKGMPKESIAWFENSPAFDWLPPEGSVPRVVVSGESAAETQAKPIAPGSFRIRFLAKYPSDPSKILLSGWALGAEKIAGKAALVEIEMGKGKIVLFGFRPQYRGQSLATFPLLFNAISN